MMQIYSKLALTKASLRSNHGTQTNYHLLAIRDGIDFVLALIIIHQRGQTNKKLKPLKRFNKGQRHLSRAQPGAKKCRSSQSSKSTEKIKINHRSTRYLNNPRKRALRSFGVRSFGFTSQFYIKWFQLESVNKFSTKKMLYKGRS